MNIILLNEIEKYSVYQSVDQLPTKVLSFDNGGLMINNNKI